MQVYKAFCKICVRNYPSVSIYVVIFLAISIMMVLSGGESEEKKFCADKMTVSILDEDQSKASAALTNFLKKRHNVINLPNDLSVIQDQLYYRRTDEVITIPKGFQDRLIHKETENLIQVAGIPGSESGYFVNYQMERYLKGIQTYLSAGMTLNEAIYQSKDDNDHTIDTKLINTQNQAKEAGSFLNYMQYLPYIMLSVLICGLSPVLKVMKGREIKTRMECASYHSNRMSMEILAGVGTVSTIIWCGMIGLGMLMFLRCQLSNTILFGMLNSFVMMLFAMGAAVLVGEWGMNGNVTSIFSNVLGLGFCFLSGVFVPQRMLPKEILEVSKFLPTYWYVKLNDMLGGFSKDVWSVDVYIKGILIQLAYAIFIFALAYAVGQEKRKHTSSLS